MSVDQKARGVQVSAGDGIVAHLQNLTAFAKGDEAQLNELLVRLNALAEAPWHEVVRTLTAGIAESNFDAHPDVACVSISEDRVAALVFGDTCLSVTTDGREHTLNGQDSSTWIDVAIHGSVEQVRAGRQSDSIIVGVLRDGVIPAGGFLLDTAGPMPSSGRWVDAPLSAPAPSELPATEPIANEPVATAPIATAPIATAPIATAEAEDTDAEADAHPAPLPLPSEQNGSDDLEDRSPRAEQVTGMFARLDARHRDDQLFGPDDFIDDEDLTDDGTEQPSDSTTSADTSSDLDDGKFPAIERPVPDPVATADDQSGSPDDDWSESDSDAAVASPPMAEQPPAIPSTGTLAPARPQLRGLLCPDGHLTNGSDVHCRTCGLATDPNAETVLGNRPVLGQLTFDDGAVLAVDRPAAIGSDVPSGYEIDGEPATVVRLDDGLGGISPVQLEVRTVGWDVEIHDMNSENGTYTILRGERQTRTRLRAGQSVILQDGMVVEVGGRSFTYTVGSTN